MRSPQFVALSLVALLSLNGCGVVYSYINNEDKLDDRLSVPMTKQQVLDALGKPDKVRRDDGQTLVWEYNLYSRYHWVKETFACPFMIFLGGCIFYPAVGAGSYEGNTTPHWVVLTHDQLCMWGNTEVVSTRKICKTISTASASQATGVSQRVNPDVMASGPLSGTMLDKYGIVAVLPFADAPRAPSSGSTVADIVSERLLDLDFTVVERATLQQLFEEQGLQLRNADEQVNAIRIGKLAGAKAVVLGNVQQWETQKDKGAEKSFVSLSFRLVDVETGAILFGGQGQFREPISAVPQVTARAIVVRIVTRMAIQTGLRGSGRVGFDTDFVDRFGAKTSVVRSVTAGLPAEKAGIKMGDVIISCNGSNSTTWKRRRDYLRACQAESGQDLMLEVARGEQRLTIQVTAVNRD